MPFKERALRKVSLRNGRSAGRGPLAPFRPFTRMTSSTALHRCFLFTSTQRCEGDAVPSECLQEKSCRTGGTGLSLFSSSSSLPGIPCSTGDKERLGNAAARPLSACVGPSPPTSSFSSWFSLLHASSASYPDEPTPLGKLGDVQRVASPLLPPRGFSRLFRLASSSSAAAAAVFVGSRPSPIWTNLGHGTFVGGAVPQILARSLHLSPSPLLAPPQGRAAAAARSALARGPRSCVAAASSGYLRPDLTSHQQLDAGIAARQHANRKALKKSATPFANYFRTAFPCSPCFPKNLWMPLSGKRRRGKNGMRLTSTEAAHLMCNPRLSLPWAHSPLLHPLARRTDVGGSQSGTANARSGLSSSSSTGAVYRRPDVLETAVPLPFGEDDTLDGLIHRMLDARFTWDREDEMLPLHQLPSCWLAFTEHARPLAPSLPDGFLQSLHTSYHHGNRPRLHGGGGGASSSSSFSSGRETEKRFMIVPAPSSTSSFSPGHSVDSSEPSTLDGSSTSGVTAKGEEGGGASRIPSRIVYLRNGKPVPLFRQKKEKRPSRTSTGPKYVLHGVETIPCVVLDTTLGPALSHPTLADEADHGSRGNGGLRWNPSEELFSLRWTAPYRQPDAVAQFLSAHHTLTSTAVSSVLALSPRSTALLLRSVAASELEHPGLSVSLGIAVTEHYFHYNAMECLEILRCLRRVGLARAVPQGLTRSPTSTMPFAAGAGSSEDEDHEAGQQHSEDEGGGEEGATALLPAPSSSLWLAALYEPSHVDIVPEAFHRYMAHVAPALAKKVWKRLPEQAERLRQRGLYLDWMDLLNLSMELYSGSVGGGVSARPSPRSFSYPYSNHPRIPRHRSWLEGHGVSFTASTTTEEVAEALPDLSYWKDEEHRPEEEVDDDEREGEDGMMKYLYVRYVWKLEPETVQQMWYWLRTTETALWETEADACAGGTPGGAVKSPATTAAAEHVKDSLSTSRDLIMVFSTTSTTSEGWIVPRPTALMLWRTVGIVIQAVAEALGDTLHHVSTVLAMVVQQATMYAEEQWKAHERWKAEQMAREREREGEDDQDRLEAFQHDSSSPAVLSSPSSMEPTRESISCASSAALLPPSLQTGPLQGWSAYQQHMVEGRSDRSRALRNLRLRLLRPLAAFPRVSMCLLTPLKDTTRKTEAQRAERLAAVARAVVECNEDSHHHLHHGRTNPASRPFRCAPMSSQVEECGKERRQDSTTSSCETSPLTSSPTTSWQPEEPTQPRKGWEWESPLAKALERVPAVEEDLYRASQAIRWATEILVKALQTTTGLLYASTKKTARGAEPRREVQRAGEEEGNEEVTPQASSDSSTLSSSGIMPGDGGRAAASDAFASHSVPSLRALFGYRYTKAVVQRQLDALFACLPWGEEEVALRPLLTATAEAAGGTKTEGPRALLPPSSSPERFQETRMRQEGREGEDSETDAAEMEAGMDGRRWEERGGMDEYRVSPAEQRLQECIARLDRDIENFHEAVANLMDQQESFFK